MRTTHSSSLMPRISHFVVFTLLVLLRCGGVEALARLTTQVSLGPQTVERLRVLRRATQLSRFQAVNALDAALYRDLSRETKISEAARVVFLPSPERPPVVIFSDACLPPTLGGPPLSMQSGSTDRPCKVASSVTIAALRTAIAYQTQKAAATTGAAAVFLCEFKVESRFVHCVMKPRGELSEYRATLNFSVPLDSQTSAGNERSGTGYANATARVPVTQCVHGAVAHNAEATESATFDVGERSTATLLSCSEVGAPREESMRLHDAIADLLHAVRYASCYCGVGSRQPQQQILEMPPETSRAELLCKCVQATAPPRRPDVINYFLSLNASNASDSADQNLATTAVHVQARWRQVLGAISKLTAEVAFLDARYAALLSHTLAGPVVAGGPRGVSSAGFDIDAEAASAAQALDVFAPVRSTLSAGAPSSRPSATPGALTRSIWEARSHPSTDDRYRQLAVAALAKVSPAHTATAAAEDAALRALLAQYDAVTSDIDGIAPPIDSTKNGERLTPVQLQSQLPPVVLSHLLHLRGVQLRLRRDVALAASRIGSTPNVDPLVVAEALQVRFISGRRSGCVCSLPCDRIAELCARADGRNGAVVIVAPKSRGS